MTKRAESGKNTSVRAKRAVATVDMRQLILETSEHLLTTEGVSALSMREVARRAGVTHQAPYHHFADRQSIIAELVTQGFEDLRKRMARANAKGNSGTRGDMLMASGKAYVGFAIDRPGIFRIMFRPEQCNLHHYPEAMMSSQTAYAELEKMVRLAHAGLYTEALACVYWAQVHGLACLIVDGPLGMEMTGAKQRKTFAKQSLGYFVQAMLTL